MKKLVSIAMALLLTGSAYSAVADYAKKLTITVNPSAVGYNAEEVANIPVAVRLSEGISGFSYGDFLEVGGGDLLFTDETGNALAHEIESWNTSGESVVWVKMPTFGSGRKLYAYYGGPANAQNAAGVWGAYVGVWHMAEADGTVADATGNGHDAVPGGNDAEQNVATVGVLGNARVNCQSGIAYLQAQGTSNLDLGDTFTVSGWFNLETANPDGQPTLITPKRTRWDGSGWGIRLQKDSASDLLVRGRGDSGDGTLVVQNVAIKDNWAHVLVVYDGWSAQVYVNGAKQTTYRSDKMEEAGWVANPTASSYPITFGYNSDNHWDDGWSRPFWGSYDEIRISDGTMSAAQAAAEYAAQTSGAFTYSVSANADAAYAAVTPTSFRKRFTVSASATDGETVTGYAGNSAYAGFPMLVRLNPSVISGFSYDDFMQPDYSDIGFFDAGGNALPFDVDTWNASGESLVWVRVPSFTKDTAITCAYGGLARSDTHNPAVWSGYRGVWHLNEATDGETTIADATANAMDGSSHVATRYFAAGQLGGSRKMATNRGASNANGGVRIPFNPALNITGNTYSLVVSAWVNLSTGSNWGGMLFTRKNNMADGGWGIAYCFTEMNHFDFYFRDGDYTGLYAPWNTGGGGYTQYNAAESIWKTNSTADEWHKYTFVYRYDGSIVHCDVYLDGVKGSECWLYNYLSDGAGGRTDDRSYAPVYQPNDRGLALGAFIGDGQHPLLGAMDEVRLRGDGTSSDREALEFAQESDASYYAYSAVSAVEGSTVPAMLTLANATTNSRTDGDGKVTLSFTATVTSVSGSGDVKLLVGVAEPKDGDPAAKMNVVATRSISSPGAVTFDWSGATLGTKVAYAVISEAALDASHVLTNSTAVTTLTLEDSAAYEWVANAQGLWSDRTKWTSDASDGLPRLGYPSYGSKINFFGNQTDVIEVDAAYSGILPGTLGWGGANITFRGVVDDAGVTFNNGGFKDGQYSNIAVTLDGVRFDAVGNFHVKGNSSLTMLNGAYLYTHWEFTVEGDNASLYVGDGCLLNQDGVDGDRFQLSGENASIVISNGTVRANSFRFGARSDSDTGYVGKIPAGFRFEGESPRLLITNYAAVPLDIGADIPVVFCIPVNGYASAPIAKDSTANRTFAERASSIRHGLKFLVDRASPFFGQTDVMELTQMVVDWTYNGASFAINADAISASHGGVAAFSYLPVDGETKSKIVVDLKAAIGTKIIFR